EKHVLEGVARLGRHPPLAGCMPNERPPSIAECHEECSAEGTECKGGGVCTYTLQPGEPALVCVARVSDERCQQALFDIDGLDESTARWGEREAAVPMRLARMTAQPTPQTLDAVWAPRLLGTPYKGKDQGAWDASQPVIALVNAYIVPEGVHAFLNPSPC